MVEYKPTILAGQLALPPDSCNRPSDNEAALLHLTRVLNVSHLALAASECPSDSEVA